MSLPYLLVTDTNIWIDLDNGEILLSVFNLPFKFITSDFAVQEFVKPTWKMLENLGLETLPIESERMQELFQLKLIHHHLSLIDLACLTLAQTLKTDLLTGDKRLTKLAHDRGINVHGLLWVIDQVLDYKIISQELALIALQKMLNKGARLPLLECQKRFKIWSKQSSVTKKTGNIFMPTEK